MPVISTLTGDEKEYTLSNAWGHNEHKISLGYTKNLLEEKVTITI